MTRLFLAVLSLLLNGIVAASAQPQRPPPPADAFAVPTAFLACTGNPYALCYYSGPNDPTPRYPNVPANALPCTPDPDNPGYANCTCYAITEEQVGPLDTNFVLIGSILNDAIREETIATCGPLGRNCLNMVNLNSCRQDPTQPHCQSAPVCKTLGSIADGTGPDFWGNEAALISTFSFTYSFNHPFGSTNCSATPGRYAGCMTAACTEPEDGLTTCSCPIVDGPYQVGQTGVQCDISPNVWSAADNLLQNEKE